MTNSSPFLYALLSNFKSIVELVIKFPGDSLTAQYGAIERVRSTILAILTHGFRLTNGDFYERLWQFVLALTANSAKYIHLLQDIYQEDNFRLTVEQWLDQSVIRQCLAEQFATLENNEELLENYYHTHAFIRVKPFYQAFLICIRTIETNDPTLLASIDPKLSIVGVSGPTLLINDVTSRSYSSTTPSTNSFPEENPFKPAPFDRQRFLLRRIRSDPIFHFDNQSTLSSETSSSVFVPIEQSPHREESFSNLTYSIEYGSSADSHSESYLSIEQAALSESTRQIQSNQRALIDSDDRQSHPTIQPTIIPDASPSVLPTRLPHSSLFWPRKGQTLDGYLRECDSQTRTAVEKENAHFYFSEAALAAIEYIRFSQKCRQYFDSVEDNSLTSSDFQRNPNHKSDDTTAENIALTIMDRWKTHRMPTAADLFWMIPQVDEPIDEKKQIDGTEDLSTSQTTERVLHRGDDLWAPPREQLIFVVHPSVSRDVQLKKQEYLCAGCGRVVEKAYAHRCRYCEYTGKYYCRSCHSDQRFYLPSYLITKWEFSNRHSVSNFAYDYLTRIYSEPKFILSDLNPKLFERSNKLRIVNELRYALFSLRYYIFTCRFAEEKGCQNLLQQLPSYIYESPDLYSMEDIIRTKSRELQKVLEPVVNSLREHVLTCSELCYAKGFICEICRNERSIIFPFDVPTTSVCPVCQSCFHIQCYRNQKLTCPKCQRARHRNSISTISQDYPPINS